MSPSITMQNSFYVSLLSNDSLSTYPQNTLSRFTNLLARPIELLGDSWHASILEIHCNYIDLNVSDAKKSTVLACVYTDFIKPGFVGNEQIRCLRIIPMTNAVRVAQSHEFRHPIYHPVNENYIESISILLADINGQTLKIHSTQTPTYILLHFKQI